MAKPAAGEDVPCGFFEALRVKIRDQGSVSNKAVYLALGIDAEGKKDVLGIWIEQNERAKFWMKVARPSRRPPKLPFPKHSV